MSKSHSAAQSPQTNRSWTTWALLAAVAVVAIVGGYFAFSDPDDAETRPIGPDPVGSVVDQAMQLAKGGQPQAGVELLTRHLERNGDDIEARKALVQIKLELRDFAGVAAQADEILKVRQNNPFALWVKGMLARQSGGDPLPYLARASRQPDADAHIWGDYGLMLMEAGDPNAAADWLNKAIVAGTPSGPVHAEAGLLAYNAGDYDRAETLLRKATALSPEHARGWLILGDLLKNQAKEADAVDCYHQAIAHAKDLDRAHALMGLGSVYQVQLDWAAAGGAYAQAIDFPTTRLEAATRAARSYYFAKQYGDAMKYVDIACGMAPTDAEIARLRTRIEDARFGPPKVKTGRSLLDDLRQTPTSPVPAEEAPSEPTATPTGWDKFLNP